MTLFPMFLKLDGRSCLVVGAGNIAAPKIESLLQAEACVTVIAPEALPQVAAWAAAGKLKWIERAFIPEDLGGSLLVVTATNVQAVNHAVAVAARERGILCNSVDDPPDCDFYYPSVVRRGDLQIAVSTAGKSPSLAQRLREEIGTLLPEDAGDWLDAVGAQRLRVLAALPPSEERKRALHLLAAREVCDPRECPVERTLERVLKPPAHEGNL